MADYGGTEEKAKEEEAEAAAVEEKEEAIASSKPLMQEEDRNTGQIQWSVYSLYITAAGGIFWVFFILAGLLAEQAAQSSYPGSRDFQQLPLLTFLPVVTTLILGWWTSQSIAGYQNSQYMGLYAGVGGAQAVVAFLSSFAFSYVY